MTTANGTTTPGNLQEVGAVLDTNVLLDIYSGHDLLAAYDNLGAEQPNAPELVFRRVRARDGVLLASYLHKQRITTCSLDNEFQSRLRKLAPPTETADFECHFTTFFVWFVKDHILPDWNAAFVERNDAGLKGTSCDTVLLDVACENGLPLITNEGFGVDGVNDATLKAKSLRARANAAGVEVYTPREFFSGKLDEQKTIEEFLHAFNQRAPAYVAQHEHPHVAKDSLLWILPAYEHVLLGTVKDGPPVQVTMAAPISSPAPAW